MLLVLFYVRVRVWCTETETVTQTQKQTRVWVSIRVRVRVRLTGKERIGVASSTQRASERACVRSRWTHFRFKSKISHFFLFLPKFKTLSVFCLCFFVSECLWELKEKLLNLVLFIWHHHRRIFQRSLLFFFLFFFFFFFSNSPTQSDSN